MDPKKTDSLDELIRRMKLKATAPSPHPRASRSDSTGAGPLRFSSSLSAAASPAPGDLSRNRSASRDNDEVLKAFSLSVRHGYGTTSTTAVVSPQKRVTPAEKCVREPITFSKVLPEYLEVKTKAIPKVSTICNDGPLTAPQPKPRTSILTSSRKAYPTPPVAVAATPSARKFSETKAFENVKTSDPRPSTSLRTSSIVIDPADFFQDNKTSQSTSNPSTSTTANQAPANSLQALIEQAKAKKAAEIEEKKKIKDDFQAAFNVPKPLFNKSNVSRDIQEQLRKLPIYKHKDKLIEAIRNNQVVIVKGETGSGKSTQIPQYLVEAGLHCSRKIAVTQPRRVAAKALATRVAKEMGVEVGSTVGYAFRFAREVSADTVIKYMTDGLLVKECVSETNLDTYSIIIIDEAHERSVQTDVCFGLLKRALKTRPDLKIIISSATLEEKKIKDFFYFGREVPVFKVDGQSYEVEKIYNPRTEQDYLIGAVDTVMQINHRQPKGDILVFLPGQEEIEKVGDMLYGKLGDISSLEDQLLIIHCYGGLSMDEQQKMFEKAPQNYRKVVLATNIAETSITIDGIVYVVDCGFFKLKEYNPKSGMQSLVIKRITQFQATQRAGRAGRTCAGKCYRLYRESDYKFKMEKAIPPEITRSNVASVVLTLVAMGISNPLKFDFVDPPPQDALLDATSSLLELKAVDYATDGVKLTSLGGRMSELPLDPPLARIVIESEDLGCSSEVVKIVAMLSCNYQYIFCRAKNVRHLADEVKKRFNHTDSDLLTLLRVFEMWESYNWCESRSESWCKENYIQYNYLMEAEEIRQQLEAILSSRRSQGYGELQRSAVRENQRSRHIVEENVRKAFTAGYFKQLAKKKPHGYGYQTLGKLIYHDNVEDVFFHPTSSLFPTKHPWVIYHDLLRTKKTYINGVIRVEPCWIKEYAPEFASKLESLRIL